MARTFQNIRLFPGMTVLENLLVAQHNRLMLASGYTLFGILGFPSYGVAEHAAINKARDWLERVDLLTRADDFCGRPALWRTAPHRDRARHVHRSAAALPR